MIHWCRFDKECWREGIGTLIIGFGKWSLHFPYTRRGSGWEKLGIKPGFEKPFIHKKVDTKAKSL